jgi:hypothetical protein
VVTITATDAAGNSSSSSFTVHVVDTTPPVLSGLKDIVLDQTNTVAPVVSYFPAISASDSGSGVLSVVGSPASGSSFTVGTTVVNVTATDNAGNTASGQFTVTVNDVPPVVNHHDNVMLIETPDASGNLSAFLDTLPPVSFTDPRQDAVDTVQVDFGDKGGIQTVASGADFRTVELQHTYTKEGNYLVTVFVTDQFGGTSFASFLVFVLPPGLDPGSVSQGTVTPGSGTNSVTISAPSPSDSQQTAVTGTLIDDRPLDPNDPSSWPTLIVAPASSSTVASLSGGAVPAPAPSVVTTSFEIRTANVGDSARVILTFHYQIGTDPTADPVVQFYDAVNKQNVSLPSSMYTIDRAAQTVTVTFGPTQLYQASFLTGLVFTVTVPAQAPPAVVTTTVTPAVALASPAVALASPDASLALSQRTASDAGNGLGSTVQFRSSSEVTISLAPTTSSKATGNRVLSGSGEDEDKDSEEDNQGDGDAKGQGEKKPNERKKKRRAEDGAGAKPTDATRPPMTAPMPPGKPDEKAPSPMPPGKPDEQAPAPEASRPVVPEVVDALFAEMGEGRELFAPTLLDDSLPSLDKASERNIPVDVTSLLFAGFLVSGLVPPPRSGRRWAEPFTSAAGWHPRRGHPPCWP